MKLTDAWRSDAGRVTKESVPFAPSNEVPGQEPVNLGQGRKILVVDDNPVVLKAFTYKLNALNFKVLTAHDGAGAIAAARELKPDLILLDINLGPDAGTGTQWNGITLMAWLQRFQETSTVPIFIMTSASPGEWKTKALNGGAVNFFQKPIQFNELLDAIFKSIGKG